MTPGAGLPTKPIERLPKPTNTVYVMGPDGLFWGKTEVVELEYTPEQNKINEIVDTVNALLGFGPVPK